MMMPVEALREIVRSRPFFLRGSVLDLFEDQVDSAGRPFISYGGFSNNER